MAYEYYDILGVDRSASSDDIKRAFRKKARELHPDVNKDNDAEERFKELNEAYDVLSDTQKKAEYDQFGTVNTSGFGGSGGFDYVDLSDIFGGGFGMGDIFSSFFGGGGGRGARTARTEGRDMGIGLRITLEEAAKGVKKEVPIDRLAPCPDCDATGLGEGGEEIDCPNCEGTGRVVTVQRTFLGNMQTASTCPECGGTGKSISNPCPECEGQGRVPDRERVTIDIPAGIKDGQQLRVTGFGEAGIRGAKAGNLIITCRIQDHEFFEREGDNLHTRASVSVAQAVLGADISIPGIIEDEFVEIHIPEGCQDGQVVRIKDKGMPRFKSSSRGDLYVHVSVIIPKKITKKQRELFEELAKELGDEISKKRTPIQVLKDALS